MSITSLRRRLINRLRYERVGLSDKRQIRNFWSSVPDLEIISSVNVEDIKPDVVSLVDTVGEDVSLVCCSTPGMFRSSLYRSLHGRISEYLSESPEPPFLLARIGLDGNIAWLEGTAPKSSIPHLSHAPEFTFDIADIDGDGRQEIVAIGNKSQIDILDFETGEIARSIPLPEDNYAVIKVIAGATGMKQDAARILVGVTDRSYLNGDYANPWVLMDIHGNILWKRSILGAGHSFSMGDFDGDGEQEILLGYQLLKLDGSVVWEVEGVRHPGFDPMEEHVDHIKGFQWQGSTYFAISASSYQYLIDECGRQVWRQALPHPQYCLVGLIDEEPVIFVFNQRESMDVFDLNGERMHSFLLPEYWPIRRPSFAPLKRPIHTNIPAAPYCLSEKSRQSGLPDAFVYLEGGFPYVADFSGRIIAKAPMDIAAMECQGKGFGRINDIGLSFEAVDTRRSTVGQQEVVLFRRDRIWRFRLPAHQKDEE